MPRMLSSLWYSPSCIHIIILWPCDPVTLKPLQIGLLLLLLLLFPQNASSHMMNIYVKFQWNLSTKVRKVGVNGRTTDGRMTWKHHALTAYWIGGGGKKICLNIRFDYLGLSVLLRYCRTVLVLSQSLRPAPTRPVSHAVLSTASRPSPPLTCRQHQVMVKCLSPQYPHNHCCLTCTLQAWEFTPAYWPPAKRRCIISCLSVCLTISLESPGVGSSYLHNVM